MNKYLQVKVYLKVTLMELFVEGEWGYLSIFYVFYLNSPFCHLCYIFVKYQISGSYVSTFFNQNTAMFFLCIILYIFL